MNQVNNVRTVLRAKDSNFSATFQQATRMLEKFQTAARTTSGMGALLAQGMNTATKAIDEFRVASSFAGLEYARLLDTLSNVSTFEIAANGFGSLAVATNQAGLEMSSVSEEMARLNENAVSLSGAIVSISGEFSLAELSLQNFVASGSLVQMVTDSVGSYLGAIANFGSNLASTYEGVSQQLMLLVATGQVGFVQLQASIASMFPTIQGLSDSWRLVSDAIRLNLGEAKLAGIEFINGLNESFTQGAAQFQGFSTQVEQTGEKSKGFYDIVKGSLGTLSGFVGDQLKMMLVKVGDFDGILKGNAEGIGLTIGNIGSYFKNMASGAMSAVQSLTSFLLTNPVGLAILAIVVVVASVTAAWQSNFMNIQGVTKSAFEAIKNAMKTFEPVAKLVGNIVKLIGDAFKFLGVMIITGALFAVALLVDQFRTVVFAGMTVINSAKAVGNAMVGLWAKIRGDNKGADEAFANMKGNIEDIKAGFDDLKENSAIKGVAESMSELGKETVDTSSQVKQLGESYKISLDEAGQRIDTLKGKYSEVGQAAMNAFSGEGLEQSSKRFEASNQIMERHADGMKAIKEKVGQELVASEELSGQEQIAAQSKAYSLMITEAGKGGAEMLTIANANSQMLAEGKTLEGELLSDEQKKAMEDQNNAIREGLMEQQNLIIESAQSKLTLGQQLSVEEFTAAKSASEALYRNQQEQLVANGEQMAALNAQKEATADEVQKANYQQQIDALGFHNSQIKEQQAMTAVELLAMMQQQEGLKAETVKASLEQMGLTTDEGLASMVEKYRESGAGVDAQMSLLAGILHQRGLESNDSLIMALQSGDMSQVGANLTEGALAGLAGLPGGMFANGDAGRQALITSLKNGTADATSVGSMLIGSMGTGIGNKQTEVANKADAVSQNATDNMKKKDVDALSAGNQLGGALGTGLSNQAPNIQSAGMSLGNAAIGGIGNTDSYSVGVNLAVGVASGIGAGTTEAVNAMRNLVIAVNLEAQKVAVIKSPSRLFRDTVGRFIAQGVAVGIEEDTEIAVASARNMITDIQEAVSSPASQMSSPTLKVEHDIQNSLVGQMKEMIESVKNMNVVLESGALVGGIGNQMDGFLGNRAGYAGRYR